MKGNGSMKRSKSSRTRPKRAKPSATPGLLARFIHPELIIAREHKFLVHGVLIGCVVMSLALEGGKIADWAFAGLAITVEVA
jgi:hypothetical protein